MSHSNKHAQDLLLTEHELQHSTQQHPTPFADEWTPYSLPMTATVNTLLTPISTCEDPLSIFHAVSRLSIESAQFDAGIDMISVRLDAHSFRGNPDEVFGPESILVSPCAPRRGARTEAPKVSQADLIKRTRSTVLSIFETSVRVTVVSLDGIPGVTAYCEFNPSHVQHEQRIRPATIDETHAALQTLDDFLRTYFHGLNHRLSWNIYRLDLAVDFTPDGPTNEIHSQALLSFRRGRSKVEQYFGPKGVIETTECRSKKAGSLKLYDKRRQMKSVHKVDLGIDLMRIEYQLRRPALREKIRTVGDLTPKMANSTFESRIRFFIKRLRPKPARKACWVKDVK